MAATTSPQENKRLVRRFPEEVATDGNIGLIEEICTADVIDHSPLGEVHGREDLEAQMESISDSFEDFSASVEDIIAEGDTVAMRVTLRGTHVGPFMGIEPTGSTFEVSNMVFTRIQNGQIAERWVLPDVFDLMQQLGVTEMPSP